MAKPPIWVSKGQAAQVGPNIRPASGIGDPGRLGKGLMGLTDQMHAANSAMQVDKSGRGSFEMHPDTMKPKAAKRVSTPLQQQAQEKAAKASASKKKMIAATKPKAAF